MVGALQLEGYVLGPEWLVAALDVGLRQLD
jgi:hypothetical protein